MNKTTRQSAEEIVPFLIKNLKPKSIIDIGCGIGIWLREFEKRGITEFLGVDGDWVKESELVIPSSKFMKANLSECKITLNRKFDIAISLEVAEHLPKQSSEDFVSLLTGLSDVVVFSAAIPLQDGTEHINEQYQEYWAKIFKKKGFIPFNNIRETFWENKKVLSHYLQNSLIYIRKSKLNKYTAFSESNKEFQLNIVHPREYERYATVCTKIKKFSPKILLSFLRKFK